MPNIFGGNQYDEDYAPHLWYKGEYVGEREARRLRMLDEKRERDRISRLIEKIGLKDFDFNKEGYHLSSDDSPLNISRDGFTLGELHEEGYIQIYYEIGSSKLDGVRLSQVELASDLAKKLRSKGCGQVIELPPRNVVKMRLEEIAKSSRKLSRKILLQ